MTETIDIEGKTYEVTGHAEDGLPIIKAQATSVHHTDEAGNPMYDKEGNPKISVNITVPSAPLVAVPGQNG